MNMKSLNILVLFISLIILTGCYENPIDTEQYFKQVYMVGAADKIFFSDIYYDDRPDTTFVSVATGGSKNIDKNIQVTLVNGTDADIAAYNNKFVTSGSTRYQSLPSSFYEIPSMTVLVKAGDIYGRMPIKINSAGMQCDSLYAIPFKISSSTDYSINSKDTVLLLSFNMKNMFSGTYQAAGTKVAWLKGAASGSPTTLSATRALTAVNKNTVRFFNWSAAETTANIPSQCLTLTINADNSVSISGWNQLIVNQGGGTYNPVNKLFTIWYLYMDGTTQYRVDETLTM